MLILAGSGGVGALAYRSSSEIVDTLWSSLADQITESATNRTLRYFSSAPPYVKLTHRLAREGRLDLGPFSETHPPDALLNHLHAAIHANPEFTWASYGNDEGTYVAVHHVGDGVLRGVWRSAGEGGTTMRELERDGDTWRVVETSQGEYDPRVRDWYRTGRESSGEWVEPFVFATVRQPGFMYVRAQDAVGGAPAGVWAVEYEVSELSAFLSELEVGEHGQVYVLTQSGLVVGHPEGETTTEVDGELEVASAEGHPDSMLAAAWSARDHAEEGHYLAGEYLAMMRHFDEASGIEWSVLVVAPEDDFFGGVRQQAWSTLIIAVVAALLAILAGAFFSNRVSGALRVIADDLERIGRFELDRDLTTAQSFVREVNEMRDTTMRMKASLRSFGKYVPRDVVRQLIESGDEAELGGRKEELSILFSDIAGFTSVAEKMDPTELVEVLGEYLDGMSAAVRDAGGTVDKYIGDAIMAFWGAPQENPDHALDACRGALAMKRKLEELQAGWDERGLPKLNTRIGVNSGDVLVGNIGAPTRLNYTVMGDAVNLAARLEALNKEYATGILVGDDTARVVGDAMVLRPIEFVAVKGKAQAVLIHELVGEKGEVDEETLAAIALHAEALDLYKGRDFEAAAAKFDEVAERMGGDLAAEKLAARARTYAEAPPPDDWDGRLTMTTK